jgi:hypothetical protein
MQKIRKPVRQAADLGEGKSSFAAVVVDPEQRALFRFLLGPGIHDIEAEVEVLRDIDPVIFFKILVGVELDTGKELIKKHI